MELLPAGRRPPNIGFYIDVGAHSPHHESVTKMFYEQGWQGINIEPQEHYYNLLCIDRPRDINLPVALGEEFGYGDLWLGDGLSTFVNKFAHTDWDQLVVPVETLAHVCKEYVQGRAIDFLKVDVEGFEGEVLRGNNWKKYRPKILCIEATIPMSETPNYELWEPFLLEQGYQFVEADRFNRYYRDPSSR